jgi:hypothetical protein
VVKALALAAAIAAAPLDPGFADGRPRVLGFPGDAGADAVAVDHRRRIVVAGHGTGPAGFGSLVTRLLPSGKLDRSFGQAGRMVMRDPYVGEFVATDSNGAVQIVGPALGRTFSYDLDFTATRFRSDGFVDESYGSGGMATMQLPDIRSGIERDRYLRLRDGGVLMAANAASAGDDYLVLAKLDGAGRPDATFGANGVRRIELPQDAYGAVGAGELADGRLIVAASRWHSNSDRALESARTVVLRLARDGTAEPGAQPLVLPRVSLVDAEFGPRGEGHLLIFRWADAGSRWGVLRTTPAGRLRPGFSARRRRPVADTRHFPRRIAKDGRGGATVLATDQTLTRVRADGTIRSVFRLPMPSLRAEGPCPRDEAMIRDGRGRILVAGVIVGCNFREDTTRRRIVLWRTRADGASRR